GRVWLGCQDQLVRFDPSTGDVRRWRADGSADAAPQGRIAQFVEQRDGSLWLASHESVQVRDADGRVLDTIHRGDGRGLQSEDVVEHLLGAPDGGVWAATTGGLLAWNDGARRFAPVPGAPVVPAYGVALGSDGLVWLAGYGQLLALRWDGEALVLLDTVDARHGLPMVAPGGVLVDAAGVVWLST